MNTNNGKNKASIAGLIVALGIIYGDIGTSPLYVMSAIFKNYPIDESLILGAVSAIFWTLTLQTSIKYVWLALNADNNGEGGIIALYALVRRHAKWLVVPAIIGGAALLADGIITPPISVASAIEGLRMIYPKINTVPIVIAIISILFLVQFLGTDLIGRSFGPIMTIWFSMLGVFGIIWIVQNPIILKAINPYYAYEMLASHPGGFWLLGAVFLCTTGAEALYSDLGHCGKQNIRISWVFVKSALLLQYFGQGAWLLQHLGQNLGDKKPIFEMMPEWFLVPGIAIATIAAIIASQALITGSFTLISESIRLNLWPKIIVSFPSKKKGQLYIGFINLFLWIGCVSVVLHFEESSNMEAAYGLAITLTMLMTTILMTYYLYAVKKVTTIGFIGFSILFGVIELSFLIANLAKFIEGGYISLFIACIIAYLMTVWHQAKKIKSKYAKFVPITDYVDNIVSLKEAKNIPRYASTLIYLTKGKNGKIEQKIIDSILAQDRKRADVYVLMHITTTDEPYGITASYEELYESTIYKVKIFLGFKEKQNASAQIEHILREIVKNGDLVFEDSIENRYLKGDVISDNRIIIFEKFMSNESVLSNFERIIMQSYFAVKGVLPHEDRWFGIDPDRVVVEKVPLIVNDGKNPYESMPIIKVESLTMSDVEVLPDDEIIEETVTAK